MLSRVSCGSVRLATVAKCLFATSSRVTGASLKHKEPKQCRRCGKTLDTFAFFCVYCKELGPRWATAPEDSVKFQKAEGMNLNPWDLFECFREGEMRFEIDEKALDAEYRKLMRQLHPDLIQAGGGDVAVQELASEHCALLRACYDALKNPVTRTIALLRWKYDLASIEEESNIDDAHFLLEILEANEEIDEALSAEGPQQVETLTQVERRWEQAEADVINGIRHNFITLEKQAVDAQEILQTIQSQLQKCRIIKKVVERAHEAIMSLKKVSSN